MPRIAIPPHGTLAQWHPQQRDPEVSIIPTPDSQHVTIRKFLAVFHRHRMSQFSVFKGEGRPQNELYKCAKIIEPRGTLPIPGPKNQRQNSIVLLEKLRSSLSHCFNKEGRDEEPL
ncbi:hypothetical protein KP509_01G068000 [Ceratopteris richardii]|uniref:Uncharacterized protein n=1 Tax=Ceratopteris richardii TaxID=49495 RepID=A0A8T2VDZ4_CERRI|nr:hypothetical protein KP509_01G068000 [Ceratopteris richardii]